MSGSDPDSDQDPPTLDLDSNLDLDLDPYLNPDFDPESDPDPDAVGLSLGPYLDPTVWIEPRVGSKPGLEFGLGSWI